MTAEKNRLNLSSFYGNEALVLDPNIAIYVKNLFKSYRLYNSNLDRVKEIFNPLRRKYHHDFLALNDVSFEIQKGETVGIIGKNGSGKSTLLKILTGVLTPTSGIVTVNGRISALLELGAGFNPEMTGYENIYFNGMLMGYSRESMDASFDEILSFADIGEFIYQPVKTYSSGMFIRLAFSVATNVAPELFIVDEALSVGDVFFQQKCYAKLKKMKDSGVTILFVTHGMNDVVQYCQKSLLLDDNKLVYFGSASESVKRYLLLQQKKRLEVFKENLEMNVPKVDMQPQSSSLEKFVWPEDTELADLAGVDEVSSGIAHCSGFAICNESARSSRCFNVGDVMSIYCEFTVDSSIEVPIAGFMIKNEQNIIVHGKNTLQYNNLALPYYVLEKGIVRFRFDVTLDIACGDYTLDAGLATITKKDYDDRIYFNFSHTQAQVLRLCHMTSVAKFTLIQKADLSQDYGAIHSGISALKGLSYVSCHYPVSTSEINMQKTNNTTPTIFHITHWKAGSQWINRILRDAAPNLYVVPKVGVAHFLNQKILDGLVYPTVYVTKEQFEGVELPKYWKRFVVIRDLRDTLISGYFSLKVSHSVISNGIASYREKLDQLNMEDGLKYLMDEWLYLSANIQESWVNTRESIIKYEDLLQHDVEILERVLIDECLLPIDRSKLREIIASNRFEQLTGGRSRGEEEITAHERKGIVGDWKNYFTEKNKEYFKDKYNKLLIGTGYETGDDW